MSEALGLYALIPNPISAAQLIVSPVAEPDPFKVTPDGVVGEVAWVANADIPLNARRIRTSTHRVYRYLATGSVGLTPPESSPATRWFDEGPTNRWAAFDALASTRTVAASPAVWEIAPGAANVLEMFGLENVDTVRLQVYASPGGPLLHDITQSTELFTDSDPHWQLYFQPPAQGRSLSFDGLDIPPAARCVVTVSSHNGAAVGVGLMAFGSYIYLGLPQFGFELAFRNYARETIDDYGNEVYRKGLKAKDLRGEAWLHVGEANAVSDALEYLLDVGAIYKVTRHADYQYLKAWGRLQPATVQPAGPSHAIVSIDVRGKI